MSERKRRKLLFCQCCILISPTLCYFCHFTPSNYFDLSKICLISMCFYSKTSKKKNLLNFYLPTDDGAKGAKNKSGQIFAVYSLLNPKRLLEYLESWVTLTDESLNVSLVMDSRNLSYCD